MKQITTLCAILALLAASTTTAVTMKHPNRDRGYVPGSMFVFDKPDSVNLFNGALAVTLPIGQQYPMSSAFSYGFSLTYTSQLWDFITTDAGHETPYNLAIPSRVSNAGAGWTISFGILFRPNEPSVNGGSSWLYIGQDGSQHHFYERLHHGDDTGAGEEDVYYTRDGSYLRLVDERTSEDTGDVIIQRTDGIEYVFRQQNITGYNDWRTEIIRDPFDNTVSIDYSTNGSDEVWTITDSHSRTHTLEFDRTANDFGDSGAPRFDSRLRRAELDAFGDFSPPAVYTFQVVIEEVIAIDRPGNPPWGVVGQNVADVPFLESITLPDGSKFSMTYCKGCDDDLSAVLEKLEQPTGGVNAWEYGHYRFSGGNTICGSRPPSMPQVWWDQFNILISDTYGVVSRKVRNASNNTGDLEWTYLPEPEFPTGFDNHVSRTVTSPDSDATKHYYSTNVSRCDSAPPTGWDYGLAFNPDDELLDDQFLGLGVFLSTEHYDGSVASANLRKTEYVAYDHDELHPLTTGSPPNVVLEQPRWWYDTNRRVYKTVTRFHDNSGNFSKEVSTTKSNFDGLGHYRTSTSVADLGTLLTGDDIRSKSSFTNFNPDVGSYILNPITNQETGSFTEWPVNDPWVIGTSTDSSTTITYVDNSTDTAARETLYDSQTGRLLRSRTYADGDIRGTHDLVTVYNYDSLGNPATTSRHGADLQTLSTTHDLATISLAPPDSASLTVYECGVLKLAHPLSVDNPNASPAPRTADKDIDCSTGLATAERDVSGLQTDFTYDDMGRLKTVIPQDSAAPVGFRGAWFELDYVKAGLTANPNPPYDPIVAKATATMTSRDPQGNAVLAKNQTFFDGFGRKTKERVRMPDTGGNPTWAKRLFRHDGRGRLLRSSTWVPDDLSPVETADIWTDSSEFDYAGRVGRVEAPGSSSLVTYSYTGFWRTYRTTHDVQVGVGQLADVTYTSTKDGFGKLIRALEPVSGSSQNQSIGTSYKYDVLGNQVSNTITSFIDDPVSPPEQTRTWVYDHLGFLRYSDVAEKTYDQVVPGSSPTLYWDTHNSRFNTLGQAGLVEDSGRTYLFIRDAYDRLREVWEDPVGSTLSWRKLKEFEYFEDVPRGYDSTDGNGWAHQKLKSTWVANVDDKPALGGAFHIKQEHYYAGVGGAISRRDTSGGRNEIQASVFTGFSYTPLGDLKELTYPQSTDPQQSWSVSADPRTVEYTYELGWPVGVFTQSPYDLHASSFSYFPNGILNEVTLGDGVKDVVRIEDGSETQPGSSVYYPKTYLPRPVAMYSEGVTQGDWRSDLEYDGAGNVVKHGPPGNQYTSYYDRLSRLLKSSNTPNSEEMAYDGFGNLISRDDSKTGGVEFQATVSTATNRFSSAGFAYDAGASNGPGNLTYVSDGELTFLYDPFDKQVLISSPVLEKSSFYDTDGERTVVGTTRGETFEGNIVIVRDLEGNSIREIKLGASWTWEKDYIRMPGRVVTSFSTDGERTLHADHLGTPRLLTDGSTQRIANHEYFPFGKQISDPEDPSGDDEAVKFTGHKRDFYGDVGTTRDIDYMHARYYSPHLGRFLTSDPIQSGRIGSSQSWNPYAYALNNPLTRIDPDGKKDKVFIFQTLAFGSHFPTNKIKTQVEESSKYTVEITNRASKAEISDGLAKADSSDIVVVFGHGNERGMQTNEGLFGGSDFITNSEIGTAVNDGSAPSACVFGGCKTAGAAESAAQSGVAISIGYSDSVPPSESFDAVTAAVVGLAQGQSTSEIQSQSDEALGNSMAETVVYENSGN